MPETGSSSSTAPSACAAAGMPQTTQVGSSWPIVRPPWSRIFRSPIAPSRPMPVSSTPMASAPQVVAALVNAASTPGTWNWPSGGVRSSTSSPRRSTVFMPAGATCTVPGARRRACVAITTGIGEVSSSQRASASTKPSAMCCTTSTGTFRSAGSSARIAASAGGPPVEAPMTITRTPDVGSAAGWTSARGAVTRRARSFVGRPRTRSRLRGWVMTRTREATRTWRWTALAYCGDVGDVSSSPITSTAPAASASGACGAISPHTTIGVGRVPMMRSIASMPPRSGARSSSTASGWWATTAASAASAEQASAATVKPGPNSRLRSARVRILLSATTTTTRGGAAAVAVLACRLGEDTAPLMVLCGAARRELSGPFPVLWHRQPGHRT